MAQIVHVVLCVACKVFQVQIVKKSSNKWVCKICNKKQSVAKEFGRGSGKYCRILVQQLNAKRAQQNEEKEFSLGELEESSEVDWDNENFADDQVETSSTSASTQQSFASGVSVVPQTKSKWSKYLGSGTENENRNEFFFK